MAKGRTLTTNRSERYLGSFGSNIGQGTSNGAAELAEDDVWSVVGNTANGDDLTPKFREWDSRASTGAFSIYSSRRRPPPPVSRRYAGGLSLAFDHSRNSSSRRIVDQFRAQGAGSPRRRDVASSAPVEVPDWSKIYRVDSAESLHELEDEFDGDDLEVVPPHEYLARQYTSRRKAAANSVFEGVGRTLKGRDLSRVRDAVWSQTGFYG